MKFNSEQLLFEAFFNVVRIYGSIVPQSESNFSFLYIMRAFSGLQMNIMQRRREPQSNGGGANFENLPMRIGGGGHVFCFEDP